MKIVASDAESQGPFVRINAADFDPSIHKEWNPSSKPKATKKKVAKKAAKK